MAFKQGLSSSEEEVLSEINMTPLVDVMLVLLVIFMLVLPVMSQAVKLDLPQANATPLAPATPQTVTLSVTQDGRFFWNSTAVDSAAMADRLRTLAAQSPRTEVRIRADQRTEYRHVMTLMALAQQSGLAQLNFMTQAEAPSHDTH
ncbi:biopolymer transporter ExbD [Paludibacterium sp. THUN1379]|uniref:ExbD/TolR family protein n=1 Tax=Paludibacterium sp. THUN1379 TaxID=3112107 RepID=UPI00308C0C15|nr:biopolymer transporter ExbD [Paludibacterium sp. THUN1379]